MRRALLALCALLLLAAAARAWFPHGGASGGGSGGSSNSIVLAFFYQDANVPSAAVTESASSPANVTAFLPGATPTPSSDGATIVGRGYQLAIGLPYDIGWCMGGDTSGNCVHASSNQATWAQQTLDCFIAGKSGSMVSCSGGYVGAVNWVYINEPDIDSGDGVLVADYNLIWNYIHTNYPGVKIGMIVDESHNAPAVATMLGQGLKIDFAIQEEFTAGGCCSENTDPWASYRATYPSVLMGEMPVNTGSLCTQHQTQLKQFGGADDIIVLWNLNTFGHWSGYPDDADWLANAMAFAATGDKSVCTLPRVFFVGGSVETTTHSSDFTITGASSDDDAWPGWTPQSTISQCQYRVLSGTNAIYGPTTSGLVETVPWSARTCDSSLPITVGAGKNCRDNGVIIPAVDPGVTQPSCIVEFRDLAANGKVGDAIWVWYTIAGI